MLDLDAFAQAASVRIADWRSSGIDAELGRSTEDGRPKAAAFVRAGAAERGGQLTVWDSGEGDLEYIADGGDVVQRHFDDLTDDEALDLLDELVAQITSG